VPWCLLACACGGSSSRPAPSPVSGAAPMAMTAPPTAAAPAAPAPVASSAPSGPAPEGPFSRARVREIVRAHYGAMTPCYVEALERDNGLRGTIEVHLAIAADGTVVGATADKAKTGEPGMAGELLVDAEVVSCVEAHFRGLRFPETGRGLVNLVYPVVFAIE